MFFIDESSRRLAFDASFNTTKVIEENRRLHATHKDICDSARSEERRMAKANGKVSASTT